MDFTLTPEQEELKTEARRWLADRFPLDRDWEADDDRWPELAELGWLDVAEAGLGFVEEALLLEEMGYALYPGPYLAHVAAGASGSERSALEVNGLVYGGDEGEAVESIDPTRPLRRVEGGDGPETVRLRAACAAEALGVAQRALDLGVEHAKTRVQFGKPVGAYQAVAHPLSQTYTDVELSRSLAYWAAWCVAEEEGSGSVGDRVAGARPEDPAAFGGGGRAPVAAAAAKAVATEAAVAACERSIQVHGGIGFTWEHPLHRFYKRALWLEGFGARPSALRLEVADVLLAGALLTDAR